VARRIAHEIKNPLTPIQLSAQRLSRFLDRREITQTASPRDSELTNLVQECSRLIEREVSTLAALVNEFSQFVRFPTAKLLPTNANTMSRGVGGILWPAGWHPAQDDSGGKPPDSPGGRRVCCAA